MSTPIDIMQQELSHHSKLIRKHIFNIENLDGSSSSIKDEMRNIGSPDGNANTLEESLNREMELIKTIQQMNEEKLKLEERIRKYQERFGNLSTNPSPFKNEGPKESPREHSPTPTPHHTPENNPQRSPSPSLTFQFDDLDSKESSQHLRSSSQSVQRSSTSIHKPKSARRLFTD